NSLEGLSTGRIDEAAGAVALGAIRRVQNSRCKRSNARTAQPVSGRRLELALRRRSSHGRGNASADADRHRHLRQTLAQPEWRAMETGRAVEVRLQRHQSNRLDSICREATCQFMDGTMAPGIWVLCQRQPV